MDEIALWLGRAVMVAGGVAVCGGLLYAAAALLWEGAKLSKFGAEVLRDGYRAQAKKRRDAKGDLPA